MSDDTDTWLSRFWQWLGDVRRYENYTYEGRTFHLPKDKCENLRRSADLATSLMQMYLAKHQKGGVKASGFIRDVQCANLMVLKEFDRVCQKHGFTYMLYGGSLLGAYRHGGFIPWDDDIDVIMPREHYEKIIDVFNSETVNHSLRTKLVSPSRGVVFIKIEAVGEPVIFIDIFPYDCYKGVLDRPQRQCQRELNQRILSRIHPDKNPKITYEYYADLRNNLGFGLTPVAHDNPECRIVVCPADCGGQYFFDSAIILPPSRAEFDDLSIFVPANSIAIIERVFGKLNERFPVNIRSHFRSGKLTVARMLNVKRFLRSDPLRRSPKPIPGRTNAKEKLWDCFVTFARKTAAPVFNVITRDKLKEYRIFSKKIFRLRADRVIRGYLEAIEFYSRFIQNEKQLPQTPNRVRQSQLGCVSVLTQVLRTHEREGLTSWVWTGNLLDAIRNGAFSPTDTKAFLLMPRSDYERFRSLRDTTTNTDLHVGLVVAYGGVITIVTDAQKTGKIFIIPCDSCPDDWDRNLYTKEMAKPENKAKVAELTAQNDAEGLYRHFADLRERMGIGLESDKNHSIFPAWDYPGLFERSHVLPAKYYMPSGKAMFEGIEVPVPADPDIVLTSMFGDWLYHV